MAVDLPSGWMRQIIGASPRRSVAAQPPRCRGTFWDNKNHRIVSLDLGRVNCYPVPAFRAASLEDEPKNVLSWELGFLEEDAAQNVEIPFNLVGNYCPGSVVIPGQTPMGWNNPC